jgi:hypothetical protein
VKYVNSDFSSRTKEEKLLDWIDEKTFEQLLVSCLEAIVDMDDEKKHELLTISIHPRECMRFMKDIFVV